MKPNPALYSPVDRKHGASVANFTFELAGRDYDHLLGYSWTEIERDHMDRLQIDVHVSAPSSIIQRHVTDWKEVIRYTMQEVLNEMTIQQLTIIQ